MSCVAGVIFGESTDQDSDGLGEEEKVDVILIEITPELREIPQKVNFVVVYGDRDPLGEKLVGLHINIGIYDFHEIGYLAEKLI